MISHFHQLFQGHKILATFTFVFSAALREEVLATTPLVAEIFEEGQVVQHASNVLLVVRVLPYDPQY